jgi:hypothetical protein
MARRKKLRLLVRLAAIGAFIAWIAGKRKQSTSDEIWTE